MFSSSDDDDTLGDAPTTPRATPASTQLCLEKEEEEEEDFQMVPLNDDHLTTKEIPDITLCLHEHTLPHRLYPYPCPYVNYLTPSYADSMDLNGISNFEE